MDHDDFVAVLAPLVLAMRAEFDAPTWAAYYRALQDVPLELLTLAVDEAIRSPREFFPKAGELRALCERQRRNVLATHPHEACIECEHSKGWRARLVDGIPRVEKCPCLERHKAKLAGIGLLEEISALPGEAGAGDQSVYPTLEQLPAGLQQQVKRLAAQKVLR